MDLTQRHLVPVGTLIAVALLLSGCSAGQDAQSSSQVAAIAGVDADAGPIALRDLFVPFRAGGYPAGDDVPLVVRLFSTSAQAVRLEAVTPAPAAAMAVGANRITLRTPTPAAADTWASALTVPAEGYLLLVPPGADYLVARHIDTAFGYGRTLPVRFTFSTGGAVEVDIPMAPPG